MASCSGRAPVLSHSHHVPSFSPLSCASRAMRARSFPAGTSAPRPRRHLPRQQASVISASGSTSARLSEVEVEVEACTWSSRMLFAAVPVRTPVDIVWRCLTDYDRLGDFVPGLVLNKCLERTSNGCLLQQVGQQEVAMGLKFSAACKLRCVEYEEGVPEELCSTSGNGSDGLFPMPRVLAYERDSGTLPRDITFDSVEGDFQSFRGVWRMQPATVGGAGGRGEEEHTLLCYSLFVQPKKWLPVGLIQDRIQAEILKNLDAVRRQAEKVHAMEQ